MGAFRAFIFLLAIVPVYSRHAFGQDQTITLEDRLQQAAESENLPEMGLLDFFPDAQQKLDLNRADEDDLRSLGLEESLVQAFMQYKQWAGPLISPYELQAIPGFDSVRIRSLLQYAFVDDRLGQLRLSPKRILAESQKQFSMRWSRNLEPASGYLSADLLPSPYLGSPDRVTLRFDMRYSNRAYVGINVDKDSGEPLWKAGGRNGFDHLGYHLFLRQPAKKIEALALGDFRVSFGQGLLIHSGFGYGKGATVTAVKKGGHRLKSHRSPAEAGFMRGAGVSLKLGDRIDLTTFASLRKRDGNLVVSDSLEKIVTSLGESGLHRTVSELSDKKILRHFSSGASLRYRGRKGHLAINWLYDHLGLPLYPREQLYNLFYFRGNRNHGLSLDYNYRFRQFDLFGEIARGSNGAFAQIHGLLWGIGKIADLTMVYRHYPPQYQSLWASPFGETSGGRNESGLYVGLALRPLPGWTVNMYFDRWRHPWLRFRTFAPSKGWGSHLRISYRKRHALSAYAEFRTESKEENAAGQTPHLPSIILRRRIQARLHIEPEVTSSLSLRFRIDVALVDDRLQGRISGICLLQDVLFRPMGSSFSFTARFAIFDSPGYELRFYHYENNLLGMASMPSYYDRGSRWYLNIRYRPLEGLTLEARIAQTFFSRREVIGSGHEEIAGPKKTTLAAQLRYAF